MKILLVAVNAKYIHSNLGIYSLKAYAQEQLSHLWRAGRSDTLPASIELAEYTINHQMDVCLQDIYRRKPDVVGFSCYIWNIEYIRALAADLKKVLPRVHIWLGGPEVSYDAASVMREAPYIAGIMKGEGEETFAQLVKYYAEYGPDDEADVGKQSCLLHIPGLVYRGPGGCLEDTGTGPVMDLSRIPFSYDTIGLKELEHRIIYYESSRGCPFSCSYCLSSIDKQVRFRNMDLVERELGFFLDARVPQVKFVDRTFNCKRDHAMAIWSFIQEHDNGITNFHFEIAADLITEDEMELLSRMRPGLAQLEIGVQTTNLRTLEAIRRKTDLGRIRAITSGINRGQNIRQHLDLIAGLPWEDMDSFRRSFCDVYRMEPGELQLGFLKVLKGSYMEEMADSYGLAYSSSPPYEVLSTRWLSYDGILELKMVEDMVEVHYNSRQFTCTLRELEKEFPSPYDMFLAIGRYYRDNNLAGSNHSRIARYEILFGMIEELPLGNAERSLETFRDLLMVDLYLRENVKSRPCFARSQEAYKARIREFFREEERKPRFLKDYIGFDSRQMSKMAHVEALGDGSLVLFDYRNRDPLTYNAAACVLEGF